MHTERGPRSKKYYYEGQAHNINQFEIGREIDVSDEVKYDSNTEKFYNRKTNEEITNRNLYLDDDEKVVEYFEFITQNKIVPNEDVSFIKYNIN